MPRIHARALAGPPILAVLVALTFASGAFASPWIGVKGNHLVDRAGHTLRLIGVNRSGTEFRCQEGLSIFDGPTDARSIEAMKKWHINAVRVPLNETCWLGINGILPELGGTAYRAAVRAWVTRLERAGLYVVLDLHEVAPNDQMAYGIPMMADADHAPEFWRSVAAEYRPDRAVLFDLYNEPHGIDWGCWRLGCEVTDPQVDTYLTAGMQQLVDAVRSTGARQPVMIGGLDSAGNLEHWLEFRPTDPAHAEVASNHTYDFGPCDSHCRAADARVARRFPLVTGEMGDADCGHDYIDSYMRWADRHGISYLAWTWNTGGTWTCESGPTLISDYRGTPTGFGVGFREHLRALAEKAERKR